MEQSKRHSHHGHDDAGVKVADCAPLRYRLQVQRAGIALGGRHVSVCIERTAATHLKNFRVTGQEALETIGEVVVVEHLVEAELQAARSLEEVVAAGQCCCIGNEWGECDSVSLEPSPVGWARTGCVQPCVVAVAGEVGDEDAGAEGHSDREYLGLGAHLPPDVGDHALHVLGAAGVEHARRAQRGATAAAGVEHDRLQPVLLSGAHEPLHVAVGGGEHRASGAIKGPRSSERRARFVRAACEAGEDDQDGDILSDTVVAPV